VTWASSSEAVAIVAEGGMVAARLDGTATITATIDGVTAHKEVTVRPLAPPPPAVATVVVSPAQLTLQPGAVVQLGARTWAADGTELFDRPITWVSSNDSLAVASATGRVEARRGGEVWITAMSEGKLGQARIAIEAWSEAPLTRVAVAQVIASLAGVYVVLLVQATDGTLAADVRPLVRLKVSVIMVK
jgi:uncharacterized protein YjdB